MTRFFIREAGMLSEVEAPDVERALEAYAHHHGWKPQIEMLRCLRPGAWAMFHGEVMVFDHDPGSLDTHPPQHPQGVSP